MQIIAIRGEKVQKIQIMKKIDRRIIIISAFIFIVVLSYGIMQYLISLKEDPASKNIPEAKRFVQSDTVLYSTIISPVEAPGRIKSGSETDIVSEASGKIIAGKIPLRKGSSFKKGDLLFTIYPDEVKLALYSRKSQFKSNLANLLPDLSFDYPDQETKLRTYFNQLHIEKDFPPFPEIQDEKLKIFLAGRNILSEYYSIKKDELQLSRHNKYAPYDGTFKEIYLEEGAYTNTGGKVAHAIRTDFLEVEVPLERFHSDFVKIGDVVEVISDNSKKTYAGTLIRKSAFVDENTQSQSIFVRVENDYNKNLLPGEYVHVTFPGQAIENAMEVPRNSVFNTNQAFIIIDGRLLKKEIQIIKVNTKTLIFRGLEEGEIIVTQPLINVLEGTKVEILGAGGERSPETEGSKMAGVNKKLN